MEEVAGVLALTEGWPAVIGLASLSNDLVLSEAEVPDELYAYCAEELLQRFEPDLRRALCTLALAPSITPDLARALYGEEAVPILDAAENGGFLTRAAGGVYDMHPLLRTVLLRKLQEEGPARIARAMRELAAFLIKAQRWDEAFAVAERAADNALLVEVVDGALDDLLTENRLETLKHWIAHARTATPSAILDLAEAEVAFREGDPSRALFHATNAASQLPDDHPRLSPAWFRAGQSAYLLDQSEEARDFCQRARATATNARDAKNAVWGLFNAALDLEDSAADALLEAIESMRPLTATDQMRLVGGRVFFASRWGGLESALEPATALMNRISRVDPMSQTAFLNNYCNGLALAAQYDEALTVIERELSLARDFSIDVAVPYALLVKGLALVGLRRFARAQEALKRATKSRNEFVLLMATIFGARIPLYQGRPERAITLLTSVGDIRSSPSGRAEFLATKALALAAMRRFDEASASGEEAMTLSQTIETSVLVASGRAVTAQGQGSSDAADLAQTAFRHALDWGNIDSFVCAYRTCPPLLDLIARVPELRPSLESVLRRVNDLALARRFGLEGSVETWQLTRREEEILGLIARGLTNKEIAEKLVVAESTAKIHVRHILRKLGVRSRTEAAIRVTMSADD